MSYIADIKDNNNEVVQPKTDWSAILNTPDFAGQIKSLQDSLGMKQDAASSFTFRSNQVIHGDTDFNTVVDSGFYPLFATNGYNAGTHFPCSKPYNSASTVGYWGIVLVMGYPNGMKIQIVFSIPGDMYVRCYAGDPGNWEDWQKFNHSNVN